LVPAKRHTHIGGAAGERIEGRNSDVVPSPATDWEKVTEFRQPPLIRSGYKTEARWP